MPRRKILAVTGGGMTLQMIYADLFARMLHPAQYFATHLAK